MEMGAVVMGDLLLVIVELEVKVTVKMNMLVEVEKVEVKKQHITVYRKQVSGNTLLISYPKKLKMKDEWLWCNQERSS